VFLVIYWPRSTLIRDSMCSAVRQPVCYHASIEAGPQSDRLSAMRYSRRQCRDHSDQARSASAQRPARERVRARRTQRRRGLHAAHLRHTREERSNRAQVHVTTTVRRSASSGILSLRRLSYRRRPAQSARGRFERDNQAARRAASSVPEPMRFPDPPLAARSRRPDGASCFCRIAKRAA